MSLRSCVVSPLAYTFMSQGYYGAVYGLSICATNLLCHRYLDEKAKIMAEIMGEDPEEEDASCVSSKTLAASYKWELRMFWFVPIGGLVHFIDKRLAVALLGICILLVMCMDLLFTIISTTLFLRPILSVMARASESHRSSAGFKGMQQTKYATLLGNVIATVSSTLLYTNIALHSFISGEFNTNPYLHPLVFMVNMGSIMSCVGMLLVSGVPKTLIAMTRACRREKKRTVLTVIPAPPGPSS
jgi:hypothetical protein